LADRLEYLKAWKVANRAKVRTQTAATARKRHAVHMTDLRAFKLLRGCFDCGYDANADALQFDHVRGVKKFRLAAATAAGLGSQRFLDELSKCEVRCANCHAIRSAKQHRLRLARVS